MGDPRRNHNAGRSQSVCSLHLKSGIWYLDYTARALADLADTPIIQTGSQLATEELEFPRRVRQD